MSERPLTLRPRVQQHRLKLAELDGTQAPRVGPLPAQHRRSPKEDGLATSCRIGPRLGLIGASRSEPAPAALGAAGGGEREAVTEAAAAE